MLLRPVHQASTVELYALDPVRVKPAAPIDDAGYFHNYKVLGQCTVSGSGEIQAVRESMQELEKAARYWDGGILACFDPRHGLRVKTARGNMDLLICYECARIVIISDGQKTRTVNFSHATRPAPQKLNTILAAHHISLAP